MTNLDGRTAVVTRDGKCVFDSCAQGDPESHWSDEQYLASYDAMGDSVSYAEEVGISAAYRCATTGAEADCARLEAATIHPRPASNTSVVSSMSLP